MKKGKIFLVDDDELIISMLSRALKKEGYTVTSETHTDEIVRKIQSWSPDVLLLDINLPERSGIEVLEEVMQTGLNLEVVMLTADDTAETAVKAMKLGAADYLTKPFNMEEVKLVVAGILEKERLKEEVGYFRKLYAEDVDKVIIGKSPPIKSLIAEVEQIAQAGVSTVLITGESGTGKELVARYLHRTMFPDEYAPFIRLNCAALPETLLETELFGYVKGAFTDAKTDKKGLFELADGGCLLLDEIGEMKMDLQSKLLRVLEERRIRRVGGKEESSVDVTVIATTNRDLSQEVEQGRFRLDLFYRLNTFCLNVVPLRERKEDVPLLVRRFLESYGEKYNRKSLKDVSREAEELLMSYAWPGNVRELRNAIERIVVLKTGEQILPEHLPLEIARRSRAEATPKGGKLLLPEGGISLEEVEKDLIVQALEKAKNNKTLAAKLLDMSYDALRYQIKKYGLE
jgi:DNA-binding NtrC family response regulator